MCSGKAEGLGPYHHTGHTDEAPGYSLSLTWLLRTSRGMNQCTENLFLSITLPFKSIIFKIHTSRQALTLWHNELSHHLGPKCLSFCHPHGRPGPALAIPVILGSEPTGGRWVSLCYCLSNKWIFWGRRGECSHGLCQDSFWNNYRTTYTPTLFFFLNSVCVCMCVWKCSEWDRKMPN